MSTNLDEWVAPSCNLEKMYPFLEVDAALCRERELGKQNTSWVLTQQPEGAVLVP